MKTQKLAKENATSFEVAAVFVLVGGLDIKPIKNVETGQQVAKVLQGEYFDQFYHFAY